VNWVGILFWGGMIYAGLCVAFFIFQDFFFFRPEKLPFHFKYKYPFPFEEINLEGPRGAMINGVYFEVPNAKGVVYYLKGNTRSVKGWGKFAPDFLGKGFSFYMIDYRGFGKSIGKRTEKTLYADAQAGYEWLLDRYKEEDIVLYGRSLGSGIAARIASWNNPRMLILDSPYYSFLHQIRQYGFILPLRWLLRYKIRTDRYIDEVSCPIFILHGRRDRLIPFRFSERLKLRAGERLRLFPIEEGHHNDLPTFPEYHDHLYAILHDEIS
jgi:fermentation-respiration switch protein FrsA (DUF1100 family)